MTKEEILSLVTWRSSDEASFEYDSPIFEKNVEIHVLTENERCLSDRSIQIVNDFIGLSYQHLETIKKFLWEDCKLNCELTSYGFEIPDGKSETEVNHQEFEVFNPEDAYKKSRLLHLSIDENDEEYTNNYGLLPFDNEWNSHLTTVVMKNGDIVGYGDSGLCLNKYEK